MRLTRAMFSSPANIPAGHTPQLFAWHQHLSRLRLSGRHPGGQGSCAAAVLSVQSRAGSGLSEALGDLSALAVHRGGAPSYERTTPRQGPGYGRADEEFSQLLHLVGARDRRPAEGRTLDLDNAADTAGSGGIFDLDDESRDHTRRKRRDHGLLTTSLQQEEAEDARRRYRQKRWARNRVVTRTHALHARQADPAEVEGAYPLLFLLHYAECQPTITHCYIKCEQPKSEICGLEGTHRPS
jgi:hypothetical protein